MTSAAESESDPRAFEAARRIVRRECGGERLGGFFLPSEKRDAANALLAFVHLTAQALRSLRGSSGAPDGGRCTAEAGGGGGGECCSGGTGTGGSTPDGGCCSGDASGGGSVAEAVRRRLDDVFAGRVDLPRAEFRDEGQWVLAAFAETVRRYELPHEPMAEFVEALVADASVTRYATWRSLGEHCRRTGGSVAALLTAILGATHSDAAGYARQIGQAARLIELVRRLKRDAARGRLYVAIEDLARCGCSEKDLLAGRVTDAGERLVRFEAARARELLTAGADGLCWLGGDGSRAAAAAFVAGQWAILDAIERSPGDVLARGDVRVGAADRLRRIPDAWRLARRRASEPLPRVG